MKTLQVSYSNGYTELHAIPTHETLQESFTRIEEETGSIIVSFSMGKGWNN